MPIPSFDVDVVVQDVDPGLLRVIFEDEVGEGIGDNRLYCPVDADWLDVAEIFDEESAIVSAAATRASDADDFDASIEDLLAQRYPGEDIDEGALAPYLWAGLDVGTISAVAALSASGCVTTTSCRGHRSRGESHPIVRFATEESRLHLLRGAVQSARCGLLIDAEGMLQLYATDVGRFLSFTRELLDLRDAFDNIDSQVVIARLDFGGLDDLTAPRLRDVDALLRSHPEAHRHEPNRDQMTLFDD